MYECRPVFDDWELSISENILHFSSYPEALQQDRKGVRDALFIAAEQYQEELRGYAEQAGIAVALPERPEFEHSIGTGHQATIFHQGIYRKYQETAHAAKEFSLNGFHLILDLDVEVGGRFVYPEEIEDRWIVKDGTLSTDTSLYAFQQSVYFTSPHFDPYLTVSQSEVQRERIRKAQSLYQQLESVPIAHAHTLVRYALHPEVQLIEVPLSILMRADAVQNILRSWHELGETLVAHYNEELDRYRKERKIKNKANPFPNLKIEPSIELPFWCFDIDGVQRSEVYADQDAVIGPNEILLPRGALNSLFYRVFCFDYFVHGLGGERYDRYTDQLIKAWLNFDPPDYAVVSETRYLFSEADDILKADERVERLRHFYGHVQDLIGSDLIEPDALSNDTVSELKVAASKRAQLIDAIQKTDDKSARSSLSQDLKRINLTIREVIDASVGDRWRTEQQQGEKSRAAFMNRSYPFFSLPMVSQTEE